MLRWYYFVSAFLVLQGLQAFDILDRLVYGEWEAKSGDKFTQSLNLLLIVASLALFGRGLPRMRRLRTGAILGIGLAGFLLFSGLWSIDPEDTARRAVLYLFVVIGAIGIAGNLEGDKFMDLLGMTCFLAGVASLVLLVVSPARALAGGIDSVDFRGIFSQKNVLGQAMVVGALASLHGLRVGSKRLRHAIIFVLVTLIALASKSATSGLTIFAFCTMDAVIALIRKGGGARILAIGVTVLLFPVVVFAAASPDSILELAGKDPTLTGRTDIWSYVLIDIYQKPWLGWGYAVFWSFNNPAAIEISDALHWFVPQAHNGLLEMLLNVGLIGTAFFIFLWIRNVRLALRCMRTSEKAMAISCLLSCAGVILLGISEIVLLAPFQASTSVFFITGLLCEKAVRAARLRRYSAAPPYPTFQTR